MYTWRYVVHDLVRAQKSLSQNDLSAIGAMMKNMEEQFDGINFDELLEDTNDENYDNLECFVNSTVAHPK